MRRIVLAVVAAALLAACNQGDQQQGTPATAAPNDAGKPSKWPS
jgi:type IV pilus biogenesis protein CpaD/CtpE